MKKLCSLFFIIISLILLCNSTKALSDIQVVACESASSNNNCDRLVDLGFVTKDQCCSTLNKCCGGTSCKSSGQSCNLSSDCCSSLTCSGGRCKTGLTNIQISTCESADQGNTCGSLTDLSIVTKEQCCSGLDKCCGIVPGCSSDIECVKCGDSCILQTQWNSSCTPLTLSFNCNCTNNTCNMNIIEGVLKITLPDCVTICSNKDGCVCLSECKRTGEVYYGSGCEGKKIQGIKEVSLCDGCLMGDTCLEIGTQKQETEGGFMLYCSNTKILEKTKNVNENCDHDYECLTYNCENQKCNEKMEEEVTNYKLILVLGGAIIVIILVFLTLRLLSSYKKSPKEEKKTKKEEGFEKKIDFPKYKYKYRPEFDILEKKLKESLGKTKK